MDYANRGRPPQRKGKKSASKGRKAPPKKSAANAKVSWGLVVLAIVLVVGLIWFLAAISGKSNQQSQAQDPAPASEPAVVTEPLPDKPDERWQYIDELENHEVQVDVPERELGPPKLMQCGSFRSETDAETLRANIAMVGLESQVRATEGSNGLWYRVILGPYESKRDAERERHQLQRAKIFGCQIWNWNL